jgi:hypothetical protein
MASLHTHKALHHLMVSLNNIQKYPHLLHLLPALQLSLQLSLSSYPQQWQHPAHHRYLSSLSHSQRQHV